MGITTSKEYAEEALSVDFVGVDRSDSMKRLL